MTTEKAPNYSQWKSQGAVYGAGSDIYLYWGKAAEFSVNSQFPAIFSSDFFLENRKPWTEYEHSISISSLPLETVTPEALDWHIPDRAVFADQFQQAQKKLQEGSISKIVLATETRAPRTISPEIFLSNALGAIPQNTHLYGKWTKDEGFLGFTPEILFKTDDGKTLETMALAGTSAIESVESTLRSSKNLQEHALVVKDISTVLENFGKVKSGDLETLSLQSLAHLKTAITVELKKALSVHELISALHPTPALGVAPRSRWNELREMRLGYGTFGAPFVVAQSSKHHVALVGIRQLAWDRENYYIRCGCGVVKESRLEEEWQELLLKIKSVKKLFGWN